MNGTSIKYDQIRSRLGAGNVQDAIDNLSDASFHVFDKALSSGDDLDDVFEEGLYSYMATCANIPYAMQTSNVHAGRLIVLHTTDAHITQIALPNQKVYDIYLRHYSFVDDVYSWSNWYPVSFNQFKQSFAGVPYSYSASFIVRCFNKPINPTNFPNSAFEITAVTRNGYVAKYGVTISETAAVITRMDGNGSNIHPELRKTQSDNVYIRMIDDTAETQPSSTETIDVYVVKIR